MSGFYFKNQMVADFGAFLREFATIRRWLLQRLDTSWGDHEKQIGDPQTQGRRKSLPIAEWLRVAAHVRYQVPSG